MTDVWHFFAEYLFILKNNVRQFQIEFSKISTVEGKVCKVHILLCICNSNPMVGTIVIFSQVEASIVNNFNKYKISLFQLNLLRIILCQTSVVGKVSAT